MTLLELIQSTPVADILAECELLDPDNEATAYEAMLARLTKTAPQPTGMVILISLWENSDSVYDVSGSDGIYHVSGLMPGSDEHYGIDFTPWPEWLASEVRITGLDMLPAQMVAQCLYEMSFFGFDPEDIEDIREGLVEAVAEVRDCCHNAEPCGRCKGW